MKEHKLEDKFNPKNFEEEIYKRWEEKEYFKPSEDKTKKPYTIVIPPPNITGKLHMGHALDETLQDILIRYKRMEGYNCLWLPGTDHAAIATEVKIVEKLKQQGIVNMLSSIYVSAQRSVENASFGMKLFGMSTVLNTGMNYLLIFGKCGFPMLGVEGAAIATLLSRVAEFAVCLFCALRSRVIPLDLKALFRPGWEMLRRFVKYASPVMANELFWGLGNSLLTVILGHMTISVEFLAANAVMGNLNRLFLVVCFGLGAATAVMIGKAIGEGQSHDELMDLSRTLSWVTILVGAALAVIALALVPLLFQPVIFPLFKLYDLSAHLATTLAVTGFACIPFHAYSISAVTGILRAGGDVFWSTALDLAPQWLVALPLTALLALVLDADPWFVSLAIQAESFIKCPICLWRIRSRKWIHDVTLPEGER